MSDKKIIVPGGMQIASFRACRVDMRPDAMNAILTAALLWLSENPIVPNVKQKQQLAKDAGYDPWHAGIVEWQRRMFFEPEPEIPELWMPFVRNAPADATSMKIYGANNTLLADIDLEAYRIGKESR